MFSVFKTKNTAILSTTLLNYPHLFQSAEGAKRVYFKKQNKKKDIEEASKLRESIISRLRDRLHR